MKERLPRSRMGISELRAGYAASVARLGHHAAEESINTSYESEGRRLEVEKATLLITGFRDWAVANRVPTDLDITIPTMRTSFMGVIKQTYPKIQGWRVYEDQWINPPVMEDRHGTLAGSLFAIATDGDFIAQTGTYSPSKFDPREPGLMYGNAWQVMQHDLEVLRLGIKWQADQAGLELPAYLIA